ncbi:MAG: 23S rRNA (guanosine(2251)-2'-O)-methyltransferase RlmB [Thermodesulfobacteria bacterium]|nr:23S rRNA (guanosine(2251)-2'-O)-methyltransferase RlmB [Thermodesulfobacteriota bacterium]
MGEDSIWIWGVHPVEEALATRPDCIERILVLPTFGKKKNQKALLELISTKGLAVERVNDFHRLRLPKGAVHQGICALVEKFWEVDADQILERAKQSGESVLVCDQIEDPQNLGAVIRAAVAFEVSGIIIPSKQNAPINGTVIKASSGALFHTRLNTAQNLFSALDAAKKMAIPTIGLDARGQTPIWDMDVKGAVCLVLGSEARGIRKNIRKILDDLTRIPINPALDSLNVSNAAAVALYELKRKKTMQQ